MRLISFPVLLAAVLLLLSHFASGGNAGVESVNVKFESAAPSGTLTMEGTLTYPKDASSAQRVPGVVLIPGSGGQNRNESIVMNMLHTLAQPPIHPLCGSKTLSVAPFLDIANYLTGELGFAVLRFDKRTCPVSNGCPHHPNFDPMKYTDFDEVDDATSALNFLAAQTMVDPSRLVVIGHSEGCSIAPLVLQKLPTSKTNGVLQSDIKAVVLLMGAGIGFDKLIPFQDQLNIDAVTDLRKECLNEGASPAVIESLDQSLAAYAEAKRRVIIFYEMLFNGTYPLDAIFCLFDTPPLGPAGCGPARSFLALADLTNTTRQMHALNSFAAPVLAINSPADGLLPEPVYGPLHALLQERSRTYPTFINVPPQNLTHFMSPIDYSSGSVSAAVLETLHSFLTHFIPA